MCLINNDTRKPGKIRRLGASAGRVISQWRDEMHQSSDSMDGSTLEENVFNHQVLLRFQSRDFRL